MKKKKILFIIWSYTSGGGAEVILANIVNNLDFTKYDVDILEYWHSDIQSLKTDKRVGLLNIIDATKDGHLKMWLVRFLLYFFPEILRKIYLKKTYDYEISFNSLIPSFLLSKKNKTISWNHSDIYDLKKEPFNYWLQNKTFKHVNRIVAISDNTYESIIQLYPQYKNKILIINNAFDFASIKEKSQEKIRIKKEKFTFLYMGRFDERKNPLFLVEVAKLLKEKNQSFELWMIGQGKLKNDILDKVKKDNLQDNVKVFDYQKNPYPYFALADVVVLSSLSEGFPTVLAEGMFLGKTFISTNVGGTKELSANGLCGFVTNDKIAYAEYAEKLINNKKLYNQMCRDAKRHIEEFTISKQIKKIETLLKEIDADK